MPNRIIREGLLESETVNCLSAPAERFFVRLFLKADDYGRYHANPQILKSHLFPLKDTISTSDIIGWMDECCRVGCLTKYQHEGKMYLEINKFRQRMRASVSKFPANGGQVTVTCQSNDGHPSDTRQTDDGHPRTEAEAYPEAEASASTDAPAPDFAEIPTVCEVITFGAGAPGIPDTYCKHYHEQCEYKNRWIRNHRLIPWRKEIVAWWAKDRSDWLKGAHQSQFKSRQKNNKPNVPNI